MRNHHLLLAGSLALGYATPARGQTIAAPDTVVVQSGAQTLRALIWSPAGAGPFPAIFFSHGSYSEPDTLSLRQTTILGETFARHGYLFFVLYRRGVGLSRDQGAPEGTRLSQAFATGGQTRRNAVQLELLHTDGLRQALAGLAALRAQHGVAPDRIAVVGHSFGGGITLLLASQDSTLRAVVVMAGAARSWAQSSGLRRDLLAAVRLVACPVLFLHAANDYSTEPGRVLAGEMTRLGKSSRLTVYPAVGQTEAEGHNFVFGATNRWETDVFGFLDTQLRH